MGEGYSTAQYSMSKLLHTALSGYSRLQFTIVPRTVPLFVGKALCRVLWRFFLGEEHHQIKRFTVTAVTKPNCVCFVSKLESSMIHLHTFAHRSAYLSSCTAGEDVVTI